MPKKQTSEGKSREVREGPLGIAFAKNSGDLKKEMIIGTTNESNKRNLGGRKDGKDEFPKGRGRGENKAKGIQTRRVEGKTPSVEQS